MRSASQRLSSRGSSSLRAARTALHYAQSDFLNAPGFGTKERLEAARAALVALVGESTEPAPSLPWQLSGVYPTK